MARSSYSEQMRGNAVALLQVLAIETWRGIEASEVLETPFGEESITEHHLLRMKGSRLPNLHVLPVNKPREAQIGADWEWFIGSDGEGWWRYAVQAKRINSLRSYTKLAHRVKRRLQCSILRDHALAENAIPLYCFYNYVDGLAHGDCWNCRTRSFDRQQLGCTLAPLDVAERHAKPRASKRFRDIHADNRVIPWRCILGCDAVSPLGHPVPHPLASKGFEHVRAYASLPPNVRLAMERGRAVIPEISRIPTSAAEVGDGAAASERPRDATFARFVVVTDLEPPQ